MVSFIIIIIWAVFRLIKYINYLGGINDPVKRHTICKVEYNLTYENVKFIVNGQEVNLLPFEYYSKILGLNDAIPLNGTKIRSAYRYKAFIVNHNKDDKSFPDIKVIDAARSYLLYQWEYMTRFN